MRAKNNNIFWRIVGAKHFKRYFIASVVIIIGIVIFAVSALQGNQAPPEDEPMIAETTPTPEPTQEPTPTPTPEPTPEPEPERGPRLYNPLTGEPRDEDLTHYRPFAFVLNNLTPALPHTGITSLDILYEFPVEGGVTRMLGIVQDISELGSLGSIRSARYYFVCVAESYDAILVHAGSSPYARDHISSRGVDNIDGNTNTFGGWFFRDPARSGVAFEHRLVANGQRVYAGMQDSTIRTEHSEGYARNLRFTEDAVPTGGGSALEITVRATASKNTLFSYDESTGQYTMRQFGRNLIDSTTDQQIGFTNILIIQTEERGRPSCRAGTRLVETVGKGTGFFINGGRYTEIIWSRADESSQFEYTLPDGSPLYLGIGRTFIGVVPNTLEHVFE